MNLRKVSIGGLRSGMGLRQFPSALWNCMSGGLWLGVSLRQFPVGKALMKMCMCGGLWGGGTLRQFPVHKSPGRL